MINSFAEPLTPNRWLLRSLAWLVGCQAGLWVIDRVTLALCSPPSSIPLLVTLGSSCVTLFLTWRYALAGSSAALLHDPQWDGTSFSWARLAVVVWRPALLLLLLWQFGGLLLFLLAMLLDKYDPSPAPLGDYF